METIKAELLLRAQSLLEIDFELQLKAVVAHVEVSTESAAGMKPHLDKCSTHTHIEREREKERYVERYIAAERKRQMPYPVKPELYPFAGQRIKGLPQHGMLTLSNCARMGCIISPSNMLISPWQQTIGCASCSCSCRFWALV